jgi:ribosome biogenesis GTPase
MARRKGKSKRRIKDWHGRFQAGEDIDGAVASRQKFSAQEVKLGDGSFSGGQADVQQEMTQAMGIVTGVFRRGVFVRLGGEQLFCGIAKTFRPPDGFEHTSPLAVGDDVTVILSRPEHTDGRKELDRNRMDGMILSRAPRRTLLARPQPRSQKQRDAYDDETFQKVIAANMDVLLIVSATEGPPMRRGLIDRFLIVAERGDLQPVLAVNKIDLAPPDENVLADVAERVESVFRCSAATGEGVEPLMAALAGRRSVLAGASGVGKSTLINAILPDADIATRSVRAKDSRGRHTTSQARVYDLPAGGLLVDTPGVRELGVDITAQELPWYFPEFEDFVADCKFRDCSHTHEPDCAVRAAVEADKIPPRRYESYLRILDTLGDNRGG